jgi:phosphate:Na+ symporter
MDTIVLLDLMGGVALLLWGLHMVRSGILRAFGSDLRHLLSKTFGNRFSAFGAGVALTALLQSSTATALVTCSFASEGMVGLVPALAIMLGANVGTTLIVQVFSFNVAAVAPVLFVIGLVAFRGGARTRIERPRSCGDRPWANAPRASHSARYLGACRERPGCACIA